MHFKSWLQEADAAQQRKNRLILRAPTRHFEQQLQAASRNLKAVQSQQPVEQRQKNKATSYSKGGVACEDDSIQKPVKQSSRSDESKKLADSVAQETSDTTMMTSRTSEYLAAVSDDSGARVTTFGSEVVTSTPTRDENEVAQAISSVTSPSDVGSARSSFNVGVEGNSNSSDVTSRNNIHVQQTERGRGQAPVPQPRRNHAPDTNCVTRHVLASPSTNIARDALNHSYENATPNFRGKTEYGAATPTRAETDLDSSDAGSMASQETVKPARPKHVAKKMELNVLSPMPTPKMRKKLLKIE